MASIAAFVYFWSSAYEVSGGCATDTLYPSFSRILATAPQPEPSAKAPCTRTTFLMPVGAATATSDALSNSIDVQITAVAIATPACSAFITLFLPLLGFDCDQIRSRTSLRPFANRRARSHPIAND